MVTSVVEPKELDIVHLAPHERPLSPATLAGLSGAIREELQRQIGLASRSSGFSRSRVVKRALVQLFGDDRSLDERRLFYVCAARSMREILLERACAATRPTIGGFDPTALAKSLCRLEMLAPHHAQVVDLHYFSGVSLREIAILLDKTEAAVACDIRFVNAWLVNIGDQRTPGPSAGRHR